MRVSAIVPYPSASASCRIRRPIVFPELVRSNRRITADVNVLPQYRGRRFGLMIVHFSVYEGPFAHMRWILHTVDAHGFYEKFGFASPGV